MALDARPLAYSPDRRRLRALLGLALAFGLALLTAGRASPLDASLAPDLPATAYMEAARAGSTGTVRGRARVEARYPGGSDEPLGGLTVTLVPRSRVLLDRLGAAKRALRDDPRRYPSSAQAVSAARGAYEQALTREGGGSLIRRTVSAADGTFDLGTVPAGPWLLLAERSVFVERPGPASSRRERQVFGERPRLVGYHTVTFWVLEVPVEPGGQVTVELTDRNAWMTGITEKRTPDTAH